MTEIILHTTRRAATLRFLLAPCLAVAVSLPQVIGADTLTVNGSGSLLSGVTAPPTLSARTGALTMASYDVVTSASVPHATSGFMSTPRFDASAADLNAVSRVGPVRWSSADSSQPLLLAQHEAAIFSTDVTPVPESSTWLTALLAAGGIIYLQRHRFLRRNGRRQTT